ncbi:hypothetical protein JCM6882_009745 [Rhodosporidiobolus microsporus]
MPSDDLPPPPSFFDKLPVELLKRIVELVHEQDKAFKKRPLRRAEHRPETLEGMYDEDFDEEVDEADQPSVRHVPRGIWSAAYGMGVRALSRLNRTLRSLAAPYLFETVTAAQLAHVYFRTYILGWPICALIKNVDMGEDDVKIIAAAWAFQHLHSATSVTFPGERLSDLFDEAATLSRHEAENLEVVTREAARAGFQRFLRRITDVRIPTVTVHATFVILWKLAPTLRRVELGPKWLSGDGYRLAQALERATLDELVVLGGAYDMSSAFCGAAMTHPSLTSLTVPVASLGRDPLPCIRRVSPNLTSLTLLHIGKDDVSASSASLPALTHLRLVGDSSCLSVLPHFNSSPLRSVELECRPSMFNPSPPSFPPPAEWSPSLRRIDCIVRGPVRPVEIEAFFETVRLTRRIEVSLSWVPDAEFHLPLYCPADERLKTRAAAIRDDLSWAQQELNGLCQAGDADGLQELASVLRRLREKRHLVTL